MAYGALSSSHQISRRGNEVADDCSSRPNEQQGMAPVLNEPGVHGVARWFDVC